jgi:hypothetical protein
VGETYELRQKLCRLEAMDLPHAQALLDKHRHEMPWREVEIGRDLEPLRIDWHSGPLAEWEKRKRDSRNRVAKVKAREGLNAEVEAFRLKRSADLGL